MCSLPRLMLACVLVCLLFVPGCGGCGRTPTAEEEAAEKEKEAQAQKAEPKPNFESKRLLVQPNSSFSSADGQAPSMAQSLRGVKPGHWMSATQEIKANNYDFLGRLDSEVVNSSGTPLVGEGASYYLATTRGAALPKGQTKRLEWTFFVPGQNTGPWLATYLRDRSGGTEFEQSAPLLAMPAYQYYFVVVAANADRYKYLESLDSIRAPHGGEQLQGGHYRVLRPRIIDRVPLPAHALTWTSMAYVLWDDVDPALLEPEQRDALLDWLHWGGQLLVSGPDTLDTLSRSFLKDYLPASTAGESTITAQQLESLNEDWLVEGGAARPLKATKPWRTVELTRRNPGRFVPGTGDLLVERAVGRGRIVVSAFSLDEPELAAWPSFDSFLNSALMGRPHRVFRPSESLSGVQVTWAKAAERQLDPLLTCGLRYFTRDTGTSPRNAPVAAPAQTPGVTSTLGPMVEQTPVVAGSGVAGWNDFSSLAQAARDSLREAAGIKIPQASFVVAVVVLYLLVLVPLNWMIFRLVGRVEWAWGAVPVISLACALLVIKLAQLDIGFARSQREIAVVELHGNYPRAHVTRYLALYTSLSTSYDIRFADTSALVQPFPAEAMGRQAPHQEGGRVVYRRDDEAVLSGFRVASNSTAMVHSEEMIDLGGSLQLNRNAGGPGIMNGTSLSLAGTAVIGRNSDGRLQAAWVGNLFAGEVKTLSFTSMDEQQGLLSEWKTLPSAGTGDEPDAESLRRLLLQAQDPASLRPGDMRLIAWSTQALPGVRVVPAASQFRQGTLLVAHLERSSPPAPQKDVNLRGTFAARIEEE